MTSARYLIGDVFERMGELPDGSVDLVLTSPPFLALRSYLPADHPDKGKEIGSEPTPAEFLDTLLALTAEWRRLLAPHGSIAVELGDTYSGSGGGGGDYYEDGLRAGQPGFTGSAAASRDALREANAKHWRDKNAQRDAWPLAKSLCGIPHLYHLSLAYGRNLLTGEPSPAGRWRVRNVVAWCRPNPPVGALGDKFRPATSYMTIATPYARRYFDLDAVRTAPSDWTQRYGGGDYKRPSHKENPNRADNGDRNHEGNPAGAPPLDYWEIPTHPYKNSHYATWPPALCKRPIEAMVPHRVCKTCGKPSERITSEPRYIRRDGVVLTEPERWESGVDDGMGAHTNKPGGTSKWREADTLGWSDCGHDNYRRGIVLDPFAGSGTTLAVATGLGRDAIGIDLDARNADLAAQRVGMFLTIEQPDTTPEAS